MGKALASMLFRGLVVLAAVSSAAPGHALTIDLTFEPSVAVDFGANTVSMTNAVAYAAQQIQNNLSDNITVNINVAAVPGTSDLGSSSTNLFGPYAYSDIVTALNSSQSTTNDASAYGSLPATDPSGGGNYYVATAEAKALGLAGPSSSPDGTVTFGAGYVYTFDPNNRAVPNKFDFIGVVEHEITEAMGRIYGLGDNVVGDGGPDYYVPYDLFRYTSSGTRTLTAGDNNYFSLDNGVTNLSYYNSPRGNGSDPQDWLGTVNDSFNAYSLYGVKNDMSAVDLAVMDVLGYHLVASNKWTWAANADGNWSGAGNWINYGVPASSAQIVFDGAISGTRTITLDVSPTAGTLTFDNSAGYTLSGSGTLTMSATQGNSFIQVLSGSHSITANLTLDSTTDVMVNSSSDSLMLAGAIGGPGGLIKNGDGKLILSGTAGSFGGGTTVLDGKLVVTTPAALIDGSNLNVGVNIGLFPDAIVPGSMLASAAESKVATVPEPAAVALLAASAVVAEMLRRRRSRRLIARSEF